MGGLDNITALSLFTDEDLKNELKRKTEERRKQRALAMEASPSCRNCAHVHIRYGSVNDKPCEHRCMKRIVYGRSSIRYRIVRPSDTCSMFLRKDEDTRD